MHQKFLSLFLQIQIIETYGIIKEMNLEIKKIMNKQFNGFKQ